MRKTTKSPEPPKKRERSHKSLNISSDTRTVFDQMASELESINTGKKLMELVLAGIAKRSDRIEIIKSIVSL